MKLGCRGASRPPHRPTAASPDRPLLTPNPPPKHLSSIIYRINEYSDSWRPRRAGQRRRSKGDSPFGREAPLERRRGQDPTARQRNAAPTARFHRDGLATSGPCTPTRAPRPRQRPQLPSIAPPPRNPYPLGAAGKAAGGPARSPAAARPRRAPQPTPGTGRSAGAQTRTRTNGIA